jgi:hypothetical protein
MGDLRSIAAARRWTVSKLFAACLIALIVTPFTAPFAVCDVADLTHSAAHGHALDDGKPAGEAIDQVTAVARFPEALHDSAMLFRSTARLCDNCSSLVRVLRI